MKKFRFRKSINEEALNPIFKVVQEDNKDKHYSNKSKWRLITYLRTESKSGRVDLFENGSIEDLEELKHVIISPVGIKAWEKLANQERIDLRERYISKIKNDFRNKDYMLAIETKKRTNNEGKEVSMEHYHLVLRNSTPTGKAFKVNYRKSLMDNYIQNFTLINTRKNLGVRNSSEAKEEKISKLKQFHQSKKESIIQQGELQVLTQMSQDIFHKKDKRYNFNRHQRYAILKNKKNVFNEISSIRTIILHTKEHIDKITDSINNLSDNKTNFVKQYFNDLTDYKESALRELRDYSLFSKYQHTFFLKYQKRQLDKGSITQEIFLTSMARSSRFFKSEEVLKRRKIEENIKNKQYEFYKRISKFQTDLQVLLRNKDNKERITKLLSNKISFKKEQVDSLNFDMNCLEDRFRLKLSIYDKYLLFIKSKIKHKKAQLGLNYAPSPKSI